MTKLYQQRLEEHNIEKYLAEIEEKDKKITELCESNDFLSKVVHRDNKLIPAMYNAVNSFLGCPENMDAKTEGMNFLNELEEIMQERKEMILKNQREYKSFPSTEIERIDAILNYMALRAAENDIEFDFVLAGSVKDIKDIVEDVIPKQKSETLLADLIENAIIATSSSTRRRILVTMGIVDDCHEITVQDSGIPFEAETLAKLGVEKSTTHADSGGSGIGYLTVFEILNESGASLTITEYAPESYVFSKSVKVRFDKKSEYIIKSFRANDLELPAERKGMHVIEYHF
jgi:signal transduction histidine kinase